MQKNSKPKLLSLASLFRLLGVRDRRSGWFAAARRRWVSKRVYSFHASYCGTSLEYNQTTDQTHYRGTDGFLRNVFDDLAPGKAFWVLKGWAEEDSGRHFWYTTFRDKQAEFDKYLKRVGHDA